MGRYDRSTTLTDSSGDFVTVGNPLPVTSTGGGGGGGTSQADKTTFGEGTGIGTPIMGVVNDTMAGLVGEDKTAAVRITPARGFHCNLRDVNGDEIGTSGAPLRIDPTGTTSQPVSGTVTIQDGGGSITVDGTVAATQSGSWTLASTQSGSWSVSITGSVTVANLNTADYDTGAGTVTQALVGIALPASGGPVAGGTSTNPVRTDPTGATAQPVTDGGGSLTVDGAVSISGSVTVTGTVAATQSGTWATQLTDGSLTASVRNTGSNDSLNVAIVDASGNQVTTFGGGTQYTDGDTDATPTGTLAVWFDTANTLRAVSAAKPLPVSASGTVAATQSGSWTVTANAGTGTFAVGQTNAATTDYDTGAGTVTQVMFGMALPASGGPVAGGTVTNPLRMDPTGTTAQPVTDNGGSLTIDGSVSVSGSVTVTGTVAATQSGTWNVGLSTGTNSIGDVRSITTSLIPGTSATHLGKAEDAGHASGDTGVFILAVRNDVRGTLAGTDLDYAPFQLNSSGDLRVDGSAVTQPVSGSVSISGSVTVSGTVAATQSGTWNVGLNAGSNTIGKVDQGTAGASAWKVDGSAVTQPVSGTIAATQSGTWTVQQGAPPWSVSQSGTWTVGLSTGTNSIGDVRSITTSVVPGTSATHLGKAEDAGHASGDTGVMSLAVRNDTRGSLAGTDLDYAPFQLNSSGDLRVDGSGVTQPISGSTTPVPTRGSFTDHSGSIVTGGAAQSLAIANSSRVHLFIQNNGVDDLWFNFGSTATTAEPSIQIPVGADYTSDPDFISTQSVSIISATTGVTFTCKEA